MRISELSRRTGVRPHQLRYYESQGLLEPDRNLNGYREYGDSAVVTVNQIKNLLAAGLSSQDIAYLQPCASGEDPEFEYCGELVDALEARLSTLQSRIDGLVRSRDALQDYIDKAGVARKRRTTG
ncbi:DNA-binding transcriptional MerR regulator [Prauserella sediminis]|uniref:DNA-binding transcriptional MerR regulator n=1 Tax=Prauserella sediminis TaxID=577680 RepID=A0A839XPW7_9PSEU|nr:MerR family transcriptional regulator [Prauserella sediminis]MBB3665280.1 DNA-binding transcriptional MerR regulator [Prauserella sediminis]